MYQYIKSRTLIGTMTPNLHIVVFLFFNLSWGLEQRPTSHPRIMRTTSLPSSPSPSPSPSSALFMRELATTTLSPTVLQLNDSGGHPYCNICGNDLFSFKFCTANITLPGNPKYNKTCCDLEGLSMNGYINPAYCPFFPLLLNTTAICGCFQSYVNPAPSPVSSPTPPTTSHVPTATFQPTPFTKYGICVITCPHGHQPLFTNVTVTGWPYDVSCSNLTYVSADSFYSPFICRDYQKQVHKTCGCPPVPITPTPSAAPSVSSRPSSLYKFPRCYICGNSSLHVTNRNVSLQFPGMLPVSCSELEDQGMHGLIQKQFCTAFSYYHLNDACGCEPTISPPSPKTTSSSTLFISSQQPAVPLVSTGLILALIFTLFLVDFGQIF